MLLTLKQIFDRIFSEDFEERGGSRYSKEHPYYNLFKNNAPVRLVVEINRIYEQKKANKKNCSGSIGKGVLAKCFWFRYKATNAESCQVVYLVPSNGKCIYLAMMLESGTMKSEAELKDAIAKLDPVREQIKRDIQDAGLTLKEGFCTEKISLLVESLTTTAYEHAVIVSKKYQKGDTYTEESLLDDLKEIIKVYDWYLSK